jgi:hypothetical protein
MNAQSMSPEAERIALVEAEQGSIVAMVALSGSKTWPMEFVATAREAMEQRANEQALALDDAVYGTQFVDISGKRIDPLDVS